MLVVMLPSAVRPCGGNNRANSLRIHRNRRLRLLFASRRTLHEVFMRRVASGPRVEADPVRVPRVIFSGQQAVHWALVYTFNSSRNCVAVWPRTDLSEAVRR